MTSQISLVHDIKTNKQLTYHILIASAQLATLTLESHHQDKATPRS